ncbi:hypothetical protein GF412_05205 [Candidatus Micrarchaeota archaeon]|nr:hypothetical protein [Candidatus Micrarchaeota archaeon]MBD3418351.1 hypothetical protein [Candidatus Micrarchaeota archaeon]
MSLIGFEEPLIEFLVGIYSAVEAVLGPDLTNFFTTAFGVAAYAIILGTFYNSFSKQKFFALEHTPRETVAEKALHYVSLIAKYTFAFPIITFVWFMFLTIFLVFLGNQDVATIMYISIAVVGAIRITAYWDEGIAADLAKMLPLGLLAYFVADPSFLTVGVFEEKFFEITQLLPISMPFFIYIVFLEWALRLLLLLYDTVHRYKHLMPEAVSSRVPVRPTSRKAASSKPASKKEKAPKKKSRGKGKDKEAEDLGEMGLEE